MEHEYEYLKLRQYKIFKIYTVGGLKVKIYTQTMSNYCARENEEEVLKGAEQDPLFNQIKPIFFPPLPKSQLSISTQSHSQEHTLLWTIPIVLKSILKITQPKQYNKNSDLQLYFDVFCSNPSRLRSKELPLIHASSENIYK